MERTRRLVGLLTLLALIVIVLGVTGVQVPLPVPGGSSQESPPGVTARALMTLLRAPPGGELAFLAVEPNGNLVVSDATRRTVLRFDANGQFLSEWGPQLGGAQLAEPAGVAVAGGSFYVLDRGMPRIFRLDSSGQLQAIIDLQQLSPYGLNGLAVDGSGNIYAADTGRNRILELSPGGQLEHQIGHPGTDLGGFTQPMMLAFAPDGGMFVADWENNRIERFDAGQQPTDAWSIGFGAFGIAVDPLGRVFAPDLDHRLIEAYTPRGASLGEIGGPGSVTLATGPKQVAVAGTGQSALYVLGADQIQRLDLENTAAPPQSGPGADLFSVLAMVLLVAVIVLAVASRRSRRRTAPALLATAPGRPVELHAENGAQPEQDKPHADKDLLIADQTERKQ